MWVSCECHVFSAFKVLLRENIYNYAIIFLVRTNLQVFSVYISNVPMLRDTFYLSYYDDNNGEVRRARNVARTANVRKEIGRKKTTSNSDRRITIM